MKSDFYSMRSTKISAVINSMKKCTSCACLFEIIVGDWFLKYGAILMTTAAVGPSDLHARVQVQSLLHQLVRGERHGHHRNGAQIVDGHAAVQAAYHAVLAVDDRQRFHHAMSARGRGWKANIRNGVDKVSANALHLLAVVGLIG